MILTTSTIHFRTVEEHIVTIRKMKKEILVLEQQLCDSATNQQEIRKNREEIERKLNDDLKKEKTEKEHLLKRCVHRLREKYLPLFPKIIFNGNIIRK